MPDQYLCALEDIEDNSARGFTVEIDGEPRDILVARRGTGVYGYLNVCPHQGTNLDWMPDRFMDYEGRFLQCATHDARFQLEDGFCIAGPCVGRSLTPVALKLAADGGVSLAEDRGSDAPGPRPSE